MSQAFFSPNKKLTGGSLIVSFNSKDAAVYFKLAKQLDFNPKGSKFDYENGFYVKMSTDECAAIARAVRRNSSTSFYHQFQEEVTSGSFKYWKIEPKKEGDTFAEGFGLSAKKGDVEVKLGFNLGSAERLARYLEFAIDHIFSADYAEDKRRSEEYKKQQDIKKAPSKKQAKPAAKETTKESDDDSSSTDDTDNQQTDDTNDASDDTTSDVEQIDF